MPRDDIRPGFFVAALGALIGVGATIAFDLRVHLGSTTITGAGSYVCAAIGGAIAAYAVYLSLRSIWPI